MSSGDNPNMIARNADGTALQSARISTNNSTNAPPTMAAPFIGVHDDIIEFVGITITLATAQNAPHTGTLFFEFSPDGGTHWDITVPVLYSSTEPFVPYPLRKVQTTFRVRYVPNDDNLTEFRLQTIYHRLVPEILTRLFNQDILLSEPVKVMRVGLMAVDPTGTKMKNLSQSAAGLLVDVAGDPLIPSKYDHLDLAYAGDNLASVVFKLGGVTVATLTLGYTGNNLTSVART